MTKALLIVLLLCARAFAQETMVVVHKWEDTVGFYDAATGQSLALVKVGVKPHEFALSPDHKLAYVTNYGVNSYTQTEEGGNTITIVDLVARQKLGEIDLGKFHRPHGIERGRSGRFYVTTDFPASLLVIDPVKRSIVRSFDIGQALPHMVVLTSDERKAYTANCGAGSVTVVDLRAGKISKQISIGGVPMGLALSRDGRRLFAVNRNGDALSVIDTRRDEVINTLAIKGQPARVRVTPNGKHLLVSLIGSGEAAIIDAASLKEIHRFKAGANAEGLGADEAGRFGYISAQGENKIVKFSLTDWKPVLEIKTGARPDPIEILQLTHTKRR